MVTPQPPERPPEPPAELPPRLQRVLAHDGPMFGRPRLTSDELVAVRALLTKGVSAGQRWHLARAMSIAADRAPDADTAALLGRFLRDATAPLPLRRRAAALLGDLPLRAASKVLLETLHDPAAGLEMTVLQALAKNGDADAASVIDALVVQRPTQSARLAEQRERTRALVLYRAGRADARADRALMPPGRLVAFDALNTADAAQALAGLRGSTFGVRADPSRALAFHCGLRHMLLLAAELPRKELMAHLLRRPAIVGVILMPDERGSATYVTRRIVVTRPQGQTVAVAVLSTDGVAELIGTLRPTGAGAHLVLRGALAARPATEVEGDIDAEGNLRLTARVLSERAAKLHGEVDPAAG